MTLPDWRWRTVVCIASGPSLTSGDCDLVRGFPTVVTNTTFRLCPWADALYGFDRQWWNLYIEEVRKTFAGRLFCQSTHVIRKDIECARNHRWFRSFGNSGACAVSLAIAAGSKRVVLVGYDCGLTCGRSHHHGDHPAPLRNCDTIDRWAVQFGQLADWAQRRGAMVFNASRETALTCFPRERLEHVLDRSADVERKDSGGARLGAVDVAGSSGQGSPSAADHGEHNLPVGP